MVCAAAVCLADQPLSKLTAGGTWHRGALNRLTVGSHGTTVTFADFAAAGPCLTRLMGEKQTVSHTAHVQYTHTECMWQVSVLTFLGPPSGPTQSEILNRKSIWRREQVIDGL